MIRLLLSLTILSTLAPLHAASVDERISLPAKINGQPAKFAFDTGAELGCALLGYEVAERFGIKAQKPGSDVVAEKGNVLIGKTEPVSFEMLGHTTSDTRLEVVDSSVVVGSFGFDGIVGWSGLRDNVISLNIRDRKSQVIRTLPADILTWKKLKIRKDKNVLVLELPPSDTASAVPQLMVDTGDPGGVSLSPKAWATWRAEHSEQLVTLNASSMPGVGLRVYEEVWADKITIGALTFTGVPVREANFLQSKFASDGAMGLAALRQLNLVADYSNGYAYVQMRTERPAFYDHNRLGAVFVPTAQSGDALVAKVTARSPAAEAGILDGDVLLKINDLDVTPWRTKPGILPLARFWHGPAGSPLRLTLKRGNQILTFSATLKDIIGPKSTKS